MPGSILVVDDDPDTARLLADALRRRGLDAHAETSARACLARMRTDPFDVVVTDVRMPDIGGIELCAQLRAEHPEVLPIVVTGHGSVDTAIAAIRAGAYDFLLKPVTTDAIEIAVIRALEHVALRRQVAELRTQAASHVTGIVGTSPSVQAMLEMIERVAPSDATVLISGESGTGKELVARALHARSPRANEPFVAINCAAMPAPLLESELFGHVRGAFTDAKQARTGLFVQAGAGTVFLDEIGEMPIEMQVKLLRVLQERRVRPVGGDTELPVHARVVTASNRDLEEEVRTKRFREDLYYRINVVAIHVPPLRERADDVLVLAQHFLARSARRNRKPVTGISPPAARLLTGYDWPGNVRELENCLERAVALCRLEHITIDDLPPRLGAHAQGKLVIDSGPVEMITLDEMERRYVRSVLAAVGGNKTRAARLLGIDRRSLYRRLEITPGPAEPAPAEPTDTIGKVISAPCSPRGAWA